MSFNESDARRDALGSVYEECVFVPKAFTARANDTQVGGDHYKNMSVEPWDVIDTWPIEQRIGAYRAGILKYVMRMGTKDMRVQEIRKAGHYCQKLAEVLEGGK